MSEKNIVDRLREEAASGHVAYTEFILKLKNNKKTLFCFFEGKDDYKYYGLRIETTTQQRFESIDCGGKENVLEVKKLIEQKKEYKEIRTSYFIDRDYDKQINITNIYCLPAYSIENQYVTKDVLSKILRNEYSILEESNDYNKVFELFEKLRFEFHEKTLMINAWLACQNDYRRKHKIKTYLRIDDTIGNYFSSIVNAELNGIVDLSDLNDINCIENLFSNAPRIPLNELQSKMAFFKNTNNSQTFRGKFELRFFVSFLDRLKSEVCKKRPIIFEKKHKCNLRFEFVTALTSLSIYAENPQCLIEYLNLKKNNDRITHAYGSLAG